MESPTRPARSGPAALAAIGIVLAAAPSGGGETLYVTEGNNLRRLDLNRAADDPARHEIFIEHASAGGGGGGDAAADTTGRRRDVNGTVCALPDGSGGFVAGEDTGQPDPPPGWGVFDRSGRQVGKLTPSYFVEQGDPHGCAFDAEGRLFTSEVGNVGFGRSRGQLFVWFPPLDRFPGEPGAYPETDATSTNYCKLATDIGTAGSVAIDAAGRVYVASASRGAIHRFSPPFPTGPDAAGGCGLEDALGSPLASDVRRDVFFRGLYTFSGLAFAANGNLYAASVFTGEILEIAPDGEMVRKLLDPPGMFPPFETGNPMGLAIDGAGNLYYADLDLVWRGTSVGPGPDGKVRRIGFDEEGAPLPPETLLHGLRFPDGLGVLPREP